MFLDLPREEYNAGAWKFTPPPVPLVIIKDFTFKYHRYPVFGSTKRLDGIYRREHGKSSR